MVTPQGPSNSNQCLLLDKSCSCDMTCDWEFNTLACCRF